ncbi:hypothetical protein PanWU01x14_296570, partial [Parasponia andersonii]
GNEALFIRVWIPFPIRRVENRELRRAGLAQVAKRTISASEILGLLQNGIRAGSRVDGQRGR